MGWSWLGTPATGGRSPLSSSKPVTKPHRSLPLRQRPERPSPNPDDPRHSPVPFFGSGPDRRALAPVSAIVTRKGGDGPGAKRGGRLRGVAPERSKGGRHRARSVTHEASDRDTQNLRYQF